MPHAIHSDIAENRTTKALSTTMIYSLPVFLWRDGALSPGCQGFQFPRAARPSIALSCGDDLTMTRPSDDVNTIVQNLLSPSHSDTQRRVEHARTRGRRG